jgi:hypothetical protein
MKNSLTLGPRQPLSRQVAWGCFTANLTVPGSGSLLAGRIVGYPQILLCFAGFVVTLVFGVRFIVWYFANQHQLQQLQDDPGQFFTELWLPLRWPALGIGLFVLALLWALTTSLGILSEARMAEHLNRNTSPPKLSIPPKITP